VTPRPVIDTTEPARPSEALARAASGPQTRRIHAQPFSAGEAPPAEARPEAGATTTFRVRDVAGHPIAAARIFADGRVSDPTGPDGTTTLALPGGVKAIVAGAPRFKLASFVLPEESPSTFDVRLEASVTLVVRVRHEDPGADPTGLRVTIAFDVDDEIRASTSRPEFNDVRGAVPVSGGGSGNHQERTYAVEAGKDLSVSGFDQGQSLVVSVEDAYAYVLLREGIKLGEDLVHPVEMVVRSKPRTIRGTVLDHDGKPLAGARFDTPRGFRAPWGGPRTDGTGKFELPDVYSPDPAVWVSAPGHVDRTVPVTNTAEPVTIRLERARQLEVTLTGPPGVAFAGTVMFEVSPSEVRAATARSDRAWSFEAVHCRAGTLRFTRHGGQPASTPIGAEETKVSVAMPE
jgi:hypothetical protein